MPYRFITNRKSDSLKVNRRKFDLQYHFLSVKENSLFYIMTWTYITQFKIWITIIACTMHFVSRCRNVSRDNLLLISMFLNLERYFIESCQLTHRYWVLGGISQKVLSNGCNWHARITVRNLLMNVLVVRVSCC